MISITVAFLLVCVHTLVVCDEYVVPENINVDEILKNERLMQNYVNCALGKGKCTPEGEQLKKSIPDALQNECAKCNEKHIEGIRKVIHYLIEKKPEWWNELEAKFDPQGEYKKRYDEYLKKEGLSY